MQSRAMIMAKCGHNNRLKLSSVSKEYISVHLEGHHDDAVSDGPRPQDVLVTGPVVWCRQPLGVAQEVGARVAQLGAVHSLVSRYNSVQNSTS